MNQNTDETLPYLNLERLVTTEMRPRNLLQGYVRPLYEAARGDVPITYAICRDLMAAEKRRVALATGFVFHPHLPAGEVDGPVGAAVLGSALQALGFQPTILVQSEVVNVVSALLDELRCSLNVVSSSDRSSAEVEHWIDEFDLAVAIEKPGRNAQGVRHTLMGVPMPEGDGNVDDFFRGMTRQGKLTIGFGDGGNEIGFGKIYDFAAQLVPGGGAEERSGGIIAATATDHLFPAALSNFGTYALTAALELFTDSTNLLVSGEVVGRLMKTAVQHGCLDGGTASPGVVADDGVPVEAVEAIVTLLHTIVAQWRSTFKRAF